MIILIDGYNYLRNVFHKEKGKLEKQREAFIRQLGVYKREKGHEVIVVFDAGLFGHATREIKNGVVVIYSGQKSSADDWIYEYVERNKGAEIILVSYDRQLVDRCKRYGADSLGISDFKGVLQDLLLGQVELDMLGDIPNYGSIEKYEKDDDSPMKQIGSEALDLLMAETNLSGYNKDESYIEKQNRKAKSKTLSKKEKKIYKKIEKL